MSSADTRVFDAMVELASCLCAEVGEELCFCGVLPGAQVAIDFIGGCDGQCGMAWVRLAFATPSTGVGVGAVNPGNCGSGLGVAVEMGVVRCVPMPDAEGNAPSAGEMLEAAQVQVADMMAMRRAVACCSNKTDWTLGEYAPIGPDGGAVGGVWNLTILVV